MKDFDELVDTDGLDEVEEARLRRMHDLLVQAGPPPELSPTLERMPTEPPEAEVVPFPLPLRRRVGAWTAVAAAVAVAVFVGGYAFGHSKAKVSAFAAQRVVPMHGAGNARAAIRIGTTDAAGNVPMLVSVSGLPQQPHPGDYYELWLTRNGKAIEPCGGFRMHGSTTTVRLSVPYRLRRFDGWVVTTWRAGHKTAGPVVLRTA